MKKQKKDNRKSEPPVTGVMNCDRGHQWNVFNLNPERVTAKCPVCGWNTSIRQGFKNAGQQ